MNYIIYDLSVHTYMHAYIHTYKAYIQKYICMYKHTSNSVKRKAAIVPH